MIYYLQSLFSCYLCISEWLFFFLNWEAEKPVQWYKKKNRGVRGRTSAENESRWNLLFLALKCMLFILKAVNPYCKLHETRQVSVLYKSYVKFYSHSFLNFFVLEMKLLCCFHVAAEGAILNSTVIRFKLNFNNLQISF